MKIFAQLIELSTGQRSSAVSGTKEELATIFKNESLRRLALEKEMPETSELLPRSNLAVLVLMDNVQSPEDMQFSCCPVMTVDRFYKWVFPDLDLEKVRTDIAEG